jgi:hypothetical protein
VLAYNKDKTLSNNQNAYDFYFIISSIIDSYRDISRFINILTLNYEGVKDDVNFIHFILVEALRYKYPLVIDSMYKQTDKLFSFDYKNNLVSLNNYDATKSTLTITISEESFQTITKKITKEVKQNSNLRQLFDKHIKKESIDSILNNFLSEFTLNESDKNIITLFFKVIFVNYQKDIKHLLNHPNYYFNYFSYRNSKDSIPMMEFEKAIKDTKNVNEFNANIDGWLSTGKENIEDCFYNYSPTDYETYKTYVLGFLHAAKIMQSSKKIRFNTRMDKVLEEKLPDLKIGDNQKELETFFNTEFIESAKYPFVEELTYLNNVMKIHFNEKVENNKDLRELEERSNSQEEIHEFQITPYLSEINLFSIITDYKYYIEKIIRKTGTDKPLDSKEFFKQVAGTNGWFHLAGVFGSDNEKKELQNILKEFIEGYSEEEVYNIFLDGFAYEQVTDDNGDVVDIRQFEGYPYMGIGSLFNNYEEFDDFLGKLQHDKIQNMGEIQKVYHMYFYENKKS